MPPFVTAHQLTRLWANHTTTNGAFSIATRPTVNLTLGTVALSIAANETGNGTRSVAAITSVSFPISVARTGMHNLTANWSLNWQVGGSGVFCFCHGNAHGSVQGGIYLLVHDRTNNTTRVTSFVFVNRVFFLAPATLTGSINKVLYVVAGMIHGHAYQVSTYVLAMVKVQSFGRPASAQFDLGAPYGGILNSVTIS